MISEQQFQSQIRLLQGQVGMFKLRVNTLRDALSEALSALEHAQFSIVIDEVKRTTAQAVHQTQRKLDDDTLRYAKLDNR